MNVLQDTLTSKVELNISCKHLNDMDVFSKSDPMAVLFQKLSNSFLEVGRSEVVRNNLNPTFAKVFEIDYQFEERQIFKLEIYDSDSVSIKLTAHDFLGRCQFSLGELVSRRRMEIPLTDCPSNNGRKQMAILTCQEMSNCKESINLKFQGSKLDKKDTFGKSDPLYELYRSNDPIKFSPELNFDNHKNFTLIYRSSPIKNTLNPLWVAINKRINHLSCGDKDRLIKFACFDWDSDGSQELIGQCFTSVNHLLSIQGKGHVLELIHPKKRGKKKNYKNSGTIAVVQAAVQIDYTFIDYISGGTELNFTVAVDFTASNGKVFDPNSLHHIYTVDLSRLNQYESAICSVGSIIQDYDSDRMFPALGFGARIPPTNAVSHCFPINLCMENPFCNGVEGLLHAYRSAIRIVKLSGPTNFSPTIRHIQRFAETHRDGSKYFVLLIITDGIITDFDATIDAIVDCSFLPMSIIIIGVGNEDFSAMDALDCDNGKLRHGQKVAERDIVQFVAIREHMGQRDVVINQAALSKAVLFELPNQVTRWMKTNGIAPLPSNKKPIPYQMVGDPSQISHNPMGADASSNPPSYSGPVNATQPPHYPMGGDSRQSSHGNPSQVPNYPMGGNAPPAPNYPMGNHPSQAPNYPMGNHPSQAPNYPMGNHPSQAPNYPIGNHPSQAPNYPMGNHPSQAPNHPMGNHPSQAPNYPMGGNAPSYPMGNHPSQGSNYPMGNNPSQGSNYPMGGNAPNYPMGGGGSSQLPPYPGNVNQRAVSPQRHVRY